MYIHWHHLLLPERRWVEEVGEVSSCAINCECVMMCV